MLSAIPSQKSKVSSCRDAIYRVCTGAVESRVKGQEFTSLVSLLSVLSVLSLLFYSNPVQAQINRDGVLLAQQRLPPLPNLQSIPINQEALPQFDAAQQTDFNSQTTYQTTPSSYEFDNQYQNQNQYQNNQNSGKYMVYVDNGNRALLQQVLRVEPKAFLKQYQGRSVIQAGTFNKPDNAQRRLKDLADNGINGVRVVSSNGQEIPYPDRNYPDRNYPDRNYPGNNRSNYYYVVIPGRSQDLQIIQDTIRSKIGQGAVILQRNQPLGSHVAVGRFTQRGVAEQWNSYLRNLGFGNARVYYGK